MSNSPLVSFTLLSPNFSADKTRNDRITIHHMAGVASAESCGAGFANPARGASSNYGIGNDGRIGLYVPEDKRSWCSSSPDNDGRAVTIEVSNSIAAQPWPVSDAAYNALIELCADICKRNGKNKLLWLGDRDKTLSYTPAANEMVMTIHRWFAATACPGDYLMERMGAIAKAVNQKLEDDDMKYYKNFEDVPSYYQDAVKKAMDKGALQGTGDGINVSEDLCRTLTVLDRLGKLD